MKRLLIILIFFVTVVVSAQTEGLSYQAVIINPATQELPGANATGNIYPNKSLSVRFTISSSIGVEYQEVQTTSTDAYGMINLVIGQGSAISGSFTEVNWDGEEKELKVEINLEGGFIQLSNYPLLYVPYALHRDIIATGNLEVQGEIDFSGDLVVNGTTNLNSSFTVNNESSSKLTGSLDVDGATTLRNGLSVSNQSPSKLTGSLDVDGASKLNKTLAVVGATTLKNSLTVLNQSPTGLTGTLTVAGVSNFNNGLNVNNQSPVYLSGDLEIDGEQILNNGLTVNGATQLNNSLSVNNQSPTLLSGTLITDGATTLNSKLNVANGSAANLTGSLKVDGATDINNTLTVDGTTTLNNTLDVTNGSATYLTGSLNVDGTTDLNSSLSVNNQSPTILTGTLTADGATTLNNTLNVTNGSATNLTGTLNVDGVTDINNTLTVDGSTTLNNTLEVTNGSATNLTGSLNVDGAADVNNTLTVDGATTLNNTLDVTNGSATNLTGTLNVDGSTDINNTLTVDGATLLNNSLYVSNQSSSYLTGDVTVIGVTSLKNYLQVEGVTHLNSRLEVRNKATTDLSGKLFVAGATEIGSAFTVENLSPTNLTGSLYVAGKTGFAGDLIIDGTTTLNNSLTVANETPTTLTGTLGVDGATIINDDLTVTGTTNLEDLNLKKIDIKSSNDTHVASFENTNDGDGDGIIIKLGRARASDGLPDVGQYEENADPASMTKYKQLLSAETSLSDKGVLIGEIAAEMLKEELKFIAGLAVGIGNKIINFLNVEILRKIGWDDVDPLWELMVALNNECDVCVPDDFTDWLKGKLVIPGFQFPDFPSIDLSDFGIVEIDITQVGFWGIPDIQLGDVVSNPLNNKNEFISFADKNSQRMGAIKAQSVENWTYNYLNPVFIYQLKSAFTSTTFDKKHSRWHFKDLISTALTSYKNIGVEYSSGNGDYAEWLERNDPNEFISTGDIVGVIGGKITRDLTNAEQVMAVSERPIVLGNIPEEGKLYLGNNIAFMGQIPVKVMGVVQTGDYIVGKGVVKGYGVAISPENMTLEDFKHTVGRAWEENKSTGPKMVNTVVGVHNGDYIKILKKYEEKFKESEVRMQSVEAKVDILTELINKKSL